jgi:hypothetical protein
MRQLRRLRGEDEPVGGLGLIVTVGLSYLGFYGEHCQRCPADGATLDLAGRLANLRSGAAHLDDAIAPFLQYLRCSGNCRTSPELKYPSAELQTLALLLEQYPAYRTKPIKIILCTFDQHKSGACAEALRRHLCDPEFARLVLGLEPDEAGQARLSVVELLHTPVNVKDEARFGKDVLYFLTKVKEKAAYLRKDQDCDSVIICATGGYKALTPFVTLLGFLRDEDVVYGYESSRSVLRLPGLPLTWDTRFLDEYRSLLRAEDVSPEYYNKLPRRVQHFFLPVEETTTSGSGRNPEKYLRSAFGTMIAESYDADRHLRYGYGGPLLERFGDVHLGFGVKLDKILTTRWNYLWLGDQIPETVEHSRGHSARLMELARDLLDLADIKLSDHELLALVVAIWLHDIGHVALASKELGAEKNAAKSVRPFPVALFPSLVRECHHVLGYERIGLMVQKAEEDQADGKTGHFPAVDTLKTVAVMTLYHRGKMPLVSGQKPWKAGGFTARPEDPPLEKRVGALSVEGQEIGMDRLLLLTSLLRFLDGCDVQADRVVDEHYAKARRRRNDDERKDLQERLDAMLPGIAGRAPNAAGDLSVALEVLKSVQTLPKTCDSAALSPEDRKTRRELRKRLGSQVAHAAATLHYANADPSYLVALGLADGILFKYDQYEHYDKHRSVACVHLERQGVQAGQQETACGERPKIEVCLLRPPDDQAVPAVCEDAQSHLLKTARLREISDNIRDEYTAVSSALSPYFDLPAVTFQPPLEDEPPADATSQFGPAKPGQGG